MRGWILMKVGRGGGRISVIITVVHGSKLARSFAVAGRGKRRRRKRHVRRQRSLVRIGWWIRRLLVVLFGFVRVQMRFRVRMRVSFVVFRCSFFLPFSMIIVVVFIVRHPARRGRRRDVTGR